jgi:NCAIR mutase (PurE)-related protein
MTAKEMLEKVKNGDISVEEAEGYFRAAPFEDLGYAKLDTHRGIRTGFPEVIYCAGKPDAYLIEIYGRLLEADGCAFGTRATKEQYQLLKKSFPDASYDEVGRILKIDRRAEKPEQKGLIAVCTAGTSDIPIAEEAAQTAEYFGSRVERIYDVGVSGLHRLLSRLPVIQKANCVIAAAGMEGALISVLGGLVANPVIAVPTSVGYGASMHGISALLTMINSCANGIAVVNIDNGYGAGYLATQINRLAAGAGEEN